jgi:transcriptional regulator
LSFDTGSRILVSNVMGSTGDMDESADVLQGTLDLLILKAASLEPMHGWAISARIRQSSREVLEVNQGSLYPALHRLVKRGWLSAEWGTSESNRKARFYRLTAAGRKQLATETATWRRFSAAVNHVLATS